MIVRRLILEAARRFAANPEIQQKAAEVAEGAYRKAQPKLRNATAHISDSMRESVRDHDPMEDPIGFAKAFKNRLLPPEDDQNR
jgi:hypothetical protein